MRKRIREKESEAEEERDERRGGSEEAWREPERKWGRVEKEQNRAELVWAFSCRTQIFGLKITGILHRYDQFQSWGKKLALHLISGGWTTVIGEYLDFKIKQCVSATLNSALFQE